MASELNGLRVAFLTSNEGVEQVELTAPWQAVKDAGGTPELIAPADGEVQGFNHLSKGNRFPVDRTLRDVDATEFDAVVVPGGVANSDFLRTVPGAITFIKRMFEAGKPAAVICHGPWLLVSAGLVRGRKMTSYHTIQDDLRNAGAEWQDAECVRDKNWVSSRQPSDLPAFNKEMIRLFSEQRGREKRVA